MYIPPIVIIVRQDLETFSENFMYYKVIPEGEKIWVVSSKGEGRICPPPLVGIRVTYLPVVELFL